MEYIINKIGSIKNNYKSIDLCPANGWESDIESEIRILPEYMDGIVGMYEGEIIHVLWWFDKAPRNILKNRIGNNDFETGVFSMRSPHRPNPIALSLCKIQKIDGNIITVKGIEALNGSAVIDIKKAILYEGILL